LQVDGQPYTVRGFTWGGTSAEETGPRMQGLADINGNTTRTWGTGADSRAIFDAAAEHDVRVIAGFWLLPGGGPGSGGCIDYRTDTTYKNDTKADILRWVQEYKDHPAVLMWNIGNEAILVVQNCYSGTDLEEIR
ncbi:beta-galactosidase, partial [Streptomyces sp. SID13726]|uniref:beta-galactosidase n=1 Tax=Streptomyces sp. SID13726 TaxID=2706058 RepID=UPI0013BE7243|nr:coagulation factor 5/8 type domain protein [Streptomyces sp. SID13726]